MKKMNTLIATALVVFAAMPLLGSAEQGESKQGESKTEVHDFKSADFNQGLQTTLDQIVVETTPSNKTSIHLDVSKRVAGWLWGHHTQQSRVTVGPDNEVEIQLQVKATTDYARGRLDNFVVNHKEITQCLRPTQSDKKIASCKSLFEKLGYGRHGYEMTRSIGALDWIKQVEISAQKDQLDSATINITGQINTGRAVLQGRDKGRLCLPMHGTPIGVFLSALQGKSLDDYQSTTRVTKFKIDNNEPIASFDYTSKPE